MNVLAHRPKALELALVQAGYTLADIRGDREVHTVEEQPLGLMAAVGRVTPRSARAAAAGVLAVGMLLAYETGVLSAAVLSVGVAAGLHLLGEMEAEATEVRHEVERPGMDHDEVQHRLIQWNEWKRIEKEQQEQEAQQAQRGQPSGRRH